MGMSQVGERGFVGETKKLARKPKMPIKKTPQEEKARFGKIQGLPVIQEVGGAEEEEEKSGGETSAARTKEDEASENAMVPIDAHGSRKSEKDQQKGVSPTSSATPPLSTIDKEHLGMTAVGATDEKVAETGPHSTLRKEQNQWPTGKAARN